MIIARLDLKAFGRFTNVSLDLSAGRTVPQDSLHANRQDQLRSGGRCFHLIYGLNESGKSTSLRAISSLLFGIPHITDDNFLHANTQMRVGGLLIDSSGNKLDCVRRRGRKATLRDGEDNEPIDESRLEEMLGGINRETFSTRFGLSHHELVAGGAAILSGEGDLGQILFAAGVGVGKLREIQDTIDETATRLFTPRGTKSVINAAIRNLDEQRKELRQAQVPAAEFSDLRKRMESKRGESSELGDQMQTCAVTLTRLRNYQQAAPLLPRWRANIESLKKIKQTPLLDDAFTERRRQATSDREVAISRQVELEARIKELTTRLESLPVDTLVMSHESEIQAVFQEVATRDKADRDRLDLIRVQKNTDRKIIDLLRELSVDLRGEDDVEESEAIEEAVERMRLSDSLRTRIRELAATHERLISSRNDASDNVETTKRRLADTVQELEAMGNVADPSVLTSAIEAVGNPQAILESLAEQQESCDLLRDRCNDLHRRLEGFDGSIAQAASLQPPSEAVTHQQADSLRAAYQKVLAGEERIKQLQSERDEANRQIRDQQSDESLPTVEDLAASRERRDRATDRVSDLVRSGRSSEQEQPQFADQVADAIEELRQYIRLTDQLSDNMRTHHEQVHRRAAMMARVSSLEMQISEAKSSLADATKDFDSVKGQWLALWETCGVKAGQPERMQRWLADHDQLCDSVRRHRDEQKRVEQTQARISRAAARLRSVLTVVHAKKAVAVPNTFQGGLFDEPQEEDLMTLFDESVALRSQWTRKRQHFDALSRRRDELAEELPMAETKFETAQNAVQQWREDWRRATESFVTSDRAGTTEVLQMLDQISDLCSKKRERDILATRIRSIGEDDLAYAARVRRLAAATGATAAATGELSEQPPTALAQSIYQRLQSERTALRGRETLREQIESTTQRLSDIAAQRSACDVVLKQLCNEAGCETAEDLPEIERAARERSELQASLRDLENQLSILAGDQPQEEFIDAAGKQQPAVLDVEIEQQEANLKEIRERIAGAQQQIGALQHELQLMDGSGRASDLVQSIQHTAGSVSRDAEEFARIKIASLILRRAIDHYRKANQSPVLAHANKFFQQLTCGEYVELKPDYDPKGKTMLFGVNKTGVAVPAGSMSDGTADALYLALRLASLQHQTSRGTPMPLIIDDCLIQLDDARAVAALKAFSDLSQRTQVILFTHHAHIKALAEQHLAGDDFHTHDLGA